MAVQRKVKAAAKAAPKGKAKLAVVKAEPKSAVTDAQVKKVLDLTKAGTPRGQIAKEVGLTIYRTWAIQAQHGMTKNDPTFLAKRGITRS
jgi:hypothetical protein